MALIKITHDLYFVAQRLKEIDDGYFVGYNTKQKRFEIHNYHQPINTFCLVVPRNKLDARLVRYVFETRRCHQQKYLEKIERENALKTAISQREIISEAVSNFGEYAFHSN